MGTVAAALLASGLLDDRRTVAGQQSGVSAIEAIEKAMEGVTPGPWQTVQTRTDIQRLTVAGPSEIVCGLDGICEPDRMNDRLFAEDAANMRYIAACNPVAMREVLDELYALRETALQLEAMQREMAEKDARIAALEAGMRPFSKFAGVVFERNFNSSDPVDTMTATDGAVSTLYARDFFSARALLGGENAGN